MTATKGLDALVGRADTSAQVVRFANPHEYRLPKGQMRH
jgi:hypothetical protein